MAFGLIAELSEHVRTAADHLEVAALQSDLIAVQSQAIEENLLLVLAACRQWLGVDLAAPPERGGELRRYVLETLQALGERSIEDIARLPEMTDPAVKAGVELLSKTMPTRLPARSRAPRSDERERGEAESQSRATARSAHGYSTFGGALGRLFRALGRGLPVRAGRGGRLGTARTRTVAGQGSVLFHERRLRPRLDASAARGAPVAPASVRGGA